MNVYLVTLGCPKNEVDSAGMAALLRRAGYTLVDEPEEAQALIVNTCGFIAPAREESLRAVEELARRKRPGQVLVAAGCMAGRYGAPLQAVPGVDALLPTERWGEIAALLARLLSKAPRPPETPPPGAGLSAISGASAYLKIAEGCSARCAFCTIPQIKGPYRSFPREALISEARALREQGVQEIILVAQDTTFYGRDRGEADGLPDLVEALLRAVPDLPWLRLMYTFPSHISPRLIEVLASYPQICPYLDIPLQHAHPAVLRRMGRPDNVEEVRALLHRLRERLPELVLRTTFIVGYPGETEDEFQTLCAFLQEEALERVGVFPYYREEGTPAARLPNPVPPEVAERRRDILLRLQQKIARRWGRRQVGKTVEVLVEGVGEDGLVVGRTRWDAPQVDGLVLAQGPARVGEIVPVRITAASTYDLWGEVVER
ncbi:MAG: 30S ribosomal protein S12 methylthiotransferase RimO [Chloroflexia bacterium]